MSTNNMPIARISVRRKEGDTFRSYSVLTAWSSKFDGLFNVTLDKGSEKYPAMGLLDAIKAVASGASIEVRMQRPRSPESRSGGSYDRPPPHGGFGDSTPDDFGGDDVPF